jgi:hypothetical protein
MYSRRVPEQGIASRWRVGRIPGFPFDLRNASLMGIAPAHPCARGVPLSRIAPPDFLYCRASLKSLTPLLRIPAPAVYRYPESHFPAFYIAVRV